MPHLSLTQLTWGLLPLLKCCPYHTKPLLFPGTGGLKARKSSPHIPWLGPMDAYLSSQAMISVINVSSS